MDGIKPQHIDSVDSEKKRKGGNAQRHSGAWPAGVWIPVPSSGEAPAGLSSTSWEPGRDTLGSVATGLCGSDGHSSLRTKEELLKKQPCPVA